MSLIEEDVPMRHAHHPKCLDLRNARNLPKTGETVIGVGVAEEVGLEVDVSKEDGLEVNQWITNRRNQWTMVIRGEGEEGSSTTRGAIPITNTMITTTITNMVTDIINSQIMELIV
jgi:hypothetical protein